ncbi:hypothetical protein HaLaN_33036, partial [Haematococcus lacustris]
ARVRRTARSSCDLLNGLEMRHGAGVWGCITTPALEKMACIEKVKKEIVAGAVSPASHANSITAISSLDAAVCMQASTMHCVATTRLVVGSLAGGLPQALPVRITCFCGHIALAG